MCTHWMISEISFLVFTFDYIIIYLYFWTDFDKELKKTKISAHNLRKYIIFEIAFAEEFP